MNLYRLAMEFSNFTEYNLACNKSVQLNNRCLCAASPIAIGNCGVSHGEL